ncbi:MAG TPA: glycoside hydrolase, partial [Armatimonadota bacterium]|nr:glycoside hydrolase [Armatimonadota bacterium]
LPAAPECGGDEALAECSKRVQALGYLCGGHDNYQDMYRDAPSWDESYIMRNPDGSIRQGGNWAGGPCWLICSRKALELARRNLPEVKRRYGFSAYFIDTTFAAPPYECSSTEHPLTFTDDIRYKGELCDLSRSFFPIHGSEEGQEWAIPHSSYFEGIMGGVLSEPPAGTRQIPLMDLVYHDCIALYTHQGTRAGPADARYIIRHLSSGRMPVYSFGPHAYFENEAIELAPAVPSVARVERGGDRRHIRVTYRWNVTGPMPPARCFVHFTDATGGIVLQDDHDLAPGTEEWQPGQTVIDGPRDVEIPEGLSGGFDVRIGLLAGDRRLRLPAADDGSLRVVVGQLHLSEKGVRFTPPEGRGAAADPTCFARADGGWGQALGATDRFIKNTYEFMSPVNEITFTMRIVDHAFLDAGGRVERTVFADPRKPSRTLTIITNAGTEVFRTGDAVLPPFGFVVESPEFVAFHALQYRGVIYEPSALFCARLVTGTAIGAPGSTVRVYHGFGSQTLRLPSRAATAMAGEQRIKTRKGLAEIPVQTEAVVRFR